VGARSTLPRTLVLVVACLLAGVAVGARDAIRWAPPAWEADGARFRVDPDDAREAGVAVLPPPGPLRFAPATAPADREAVLAAIASARPEARGLIARVTGLTTVSVGATGPDSAGVARSNAEGWDVELDLASIAPRFGPRGTARLVLHELAHVVDHALVTSDLERTLDRATPAGLVCTEDGIAGACARARSASRRASPSGRSATSA
jgi:hypothetical protein